MHNPLVAGSNPAGPIFQTRRQGEEATRRRGEEETGRFTFRETQTVPPCLLFSLSPLLLFSLSPYHPYNPATSTMTRHSTLSAGLLILTTGLGTVLFSGAPGPQAGKAPAAK